MKNIKTLESYFSLSKSRDWLTYIFLLCGSVGIMYITLKMGVVFGIIILILLLATAVVLFCLLNPLVSLIVGISLSLFVAYITRFFWIYYHIDPNFGVVIDLIFVLGLLAVLLEQYRNKEVSLYFAQNPFTFFFLIYITFLIVELFNPNVNIYLGWISFFRRIITLFSCYIIVLYLFKSIDFIKLFIKLWLILAFISAIYGCSQEWFGFMPLEEYVVNSATEDNGFNAFFHSGFLRKFSFFSDPTAFGMFMAISGIFCVILLAGPFKKKSKLKILIISIFIFLAMAYSGTRTAYIMVPAGLTLFVLMTITRKSTLFITTTLVMLLGIILFGPIYGNPTINRIRTAFTFSEDASMNLRDIKRNLTQPLIFEHPFIGGGVESSGIIGSKYDPTHYLAEHVIDSGYVKTALETGIIGLIVVLTFYFVGMYLGVRNFYGTKNQEVRTYILGMLAVIYALVVATFVQKSINQIPSGLILYGLFAIIAKMPKVKGYEAINHDNAND